MNDFINSNKTTFLNRLKNWARQIKRELKVLQIAVTHKLVPWYAKAIIILTIAYALSPIDLIPDFIPVLGLLDDLIILPFLIYIAIKLIPKDVIQYCRQQAEKTELKDKKNIIAGGVIILIWITTLVWLIVKLMR
jgi:uncharacterized membrane protein YkvA (DUF1232 family)